jgi:hypothetical protein
VIRRKTFALEPMTPDEAAFDMDLLGHDFLLFTDLSSGQDAVIWRTDTGYRVQGEVSASERASTASPVEFDGPVPTLTEEEALQRLDLTGAPFVFHRDPETRRGRVLYLRYDGHCGVITAGAQSPPRQRTAE